MKALLDVLSKSIVGQYDLVRNAVLGLLVGRPTLFVGPPGTAKTYVVRLMSNLIDCGGRQCRFSYVLLNRFTEPDEVFGPIDLTALRSGVYRRRIEDGIITADLAFLDEIFNASTAILNTLLHVLLYGEYVNGGEVIKVQWFTVYAASNRIPNEVEYDALIDRFTIKTFLNYVPERLLPALVAAEAPAGAAVVSKRELLAARGEVYNTAAAVARSKIMQEVVPDVKALREEVGLRLSDRGVKEAVVVAAALAHLYDADVTRAELLEALIMSGARSQSEYERAMEYFRSSVLDAELRRAHAVYSDLLHIGEDKTLRKEAQSVIKSAKKSRNRLLKEYAHRIVALL